MLMKLGRLFVFAYFVGAGVTWTSGDARESVEGRFALGDLLGLVIILIAFVHRLIIARGAVRIPQVYRAYLPMIIVFLAGLIIARSPERLLLELGIHVFLLAVSIAIYNILAHKLSDVSLEEIFVALLYAGGLLAAVALLDFFIFPNLLPGITYAVVGTFRNTGQAGAFYGTYIALLVPAFLAGLIRPTLIRSLALTCLLVALVFTFKRSALVGVFVGLSLLGFMLIFSTSKREKRYGLVFLAVFAIILGLGGSVFAWVLENVPGVAGWFGRKFSADTVESFAGGFLAHNIDMARAAVEVNPLFGVGLGNVVGTVSDRYEIHSTYLAVAATSGILGCIAYMLFMVRLVWPAMASSVGKTREAQYLRYLLPMLAGLMISWAYTYHLRKREFWILVAVMALVSLAARLRRSDLGTGLVGARKLPGG